MDTKKQADETQPINAFGTAPSVKPALKQTSYAGTLLKDRYLIEGELGRGGIGVVYLARDTQLLQRPVVIKVLLESSENSMHTPWFRKKFDQEVEALVRIDHPGVVGVLDAGIMPDGKPFFVMQFVEGVTLREVMQQQKFDFARVGTLVRQIGYALTAAHDKGVIHRDLKPENVMVVNVGLPDEMAKLIDFGIATVLDSQTTGTNDTEKTKVAGALPYMAPEQLRGQPAASSDVWSLAVMAYEMLTGQMPFYANTLVTLHDLQRQGVTVPPVKLRGDLSAAANQVVLKSLAFEPAERHARARDFGDALATALQAPAARETVVTPPPTMVQPQPSPAAPGGATAINSAPTAPLPFAAETNVVAPQDAPTQNLQAVSGIPLAPPVAVPPSTGDARRPATGRSPLPMFVGIAFLIAAVVGVISFYKMRNAKPSHLPTNIDKAEVMVDDAPKPVLQYSLSARLKKANGQKAEYAEPAVFAAGDEVRFNLRSMDTGFLYIVNEGPQNKGGLPVYNILHPAPELSDAVLDKGRPLWLPSENPPWFIVDKEEGTERFWLVWATYKVPELEAARKFLNAQDGGEIKDPAIVQSLKTYFESNREEAKPVAEKEETHTTLKLRPNGKAGLMIYPLKFEHH